MELLELLEAVPVQLKTQRRLQTLDFMLVHLFTKLANWPPFGWLLRSFLPTVCGIQVLVSGWWRRTALQLCVPSRCAVNSSWNCCWLMGALCWLARTALWIAKLLVTQMSTRCWNTVVVHLLVCCVDWSGSQREIRGVNPSHVLVVLFHCCGSGDGHFLELLTRRGWDLHWMCNINNNKWSSKKIYHHNMYKYTCFTIWHTHHSDK